MDDDLLPIGRFARPRRADRSAPSVTTTRRASSCRPTWIRATGYRRYRRDQLPTARAIAALRDLELSLPAIRALLEADDADDRGAILATSGSGSRPAPPASNGRSTG